MSIRVLIVLTCILGAAVLPQVAEACDPADDYQAPPNNIQPYDSQNAPEPPVIVDAWVSHNSADGSGCGGSCGPFNGLHLVLTGVASDHILRIKHEDGSVAFARTHNYTNASGEQEIFLLGYVDVDEDMPFTLAVIDADGNPSVEVESLAVIEEENDAGCSAGGASTNLGLSLFVLLVLITRRRTIQNR